MGSWGHAQSIATKTASASNDAESILERMLLLRSRMRKAEFEVHHLVVSEQRAASRQAEIRQQVAFDFTQKSVSFQNQNNSFEMGDFLPGSFFDVRTFGLAEIQLFSSNPKMESVHKEIRKWIDFKNAKVEMPSEESLVITGLTDDRRWRLELDRKRGLIPIGRKIEYGRFNPQTNQFEPSGETIESRVEWSVFQNTQVPFQLHQVLTRPANQFKQTTTITLEWKSVE